MKANEEIIIRCIKKIEKNTVCKIEDISRAFSKTDSEYEVMTLKNFYVCSLKNGNVEMRKYDSKNKRYEYYVFNEDCKLIRKYFVK